MKRIDRADYQALLAAATVIERDAYGEKVLARKDGLLVKIFRRKRWLSTALFYPYARRFVRNARLLVARDILTVSVVDVAFCPEVARHLVTYRPLPGVTLRQALASDPQGRLPLLKEFSVFVATLHRKGVYFRSLHFGNVIVPSDGGELGLIDIADLSCRRRALSLRQRSRNFRHMLRYREDIGYLHEAGSRWFLDQYLFAAGLVGSDRDRFLKMLDGLAGAPLSSV